ncbi:hypothetical protein BU23DRAFT_597190 [Bimuria novae-zelandiae CBS 107.79]|uniref:Uncharacterized protein n=1 Tax=Bimuria novae-zelandiae CBS 107.79 TaxID=1447943 RepID=A0A6A5VN11_9PLEO|nr:hypothetical protein BU23DRAFT_597190 [Bimuria novae-zelandiae CBS 107.79]
MKWIEVEVYPPIVERYGNKFFKCDCRACDSNKYDTCGNGKEHKDVEKVGRNQDLDHNQWDSRPEALQLTDAIIDTVRRLEKDVSPVQQGAIDESRKKWNAENGWCQSFKQEDLQTVMGVKELHGIFMCLSNIFFSSTNPVDRYDKKKSSKKNQKKGKKGTKYWGTSQDGLEVKFETDLEKSDATG